MITKIRISNFYSIGKEVEIDFMKGGSEKEPGYFLYKKDKKISLVNGFFGSNASGKSNILSSMINLIRMVYNVYSPQNVMGEVLLYQPNMHRDFTNKPTKLGIDFLFGNNYYTYDLEIKDSNNITREELFLTNLSIKSAKPKKIFTRQDTTITFGPEYKEYSTYASNIKIQKYQTFISHLITLGVNAVIDFINNRDSFFLRNDSIDIILPSHISLITRVMRLNSLDQEKKDEFLKTTKEMMNCFDNSIDDLQIDTTNNGLSIKVTHKDFTKSIDIHQESAGTREIFQYIYDILAAVKKGGVVIYDETNRYYHPDIEIALLSIFKNEEFNTQNAQIFFASHNHETFDLLELDQAHIVEKTDSSSSVYKLSEIEDLKKRDNLKKKYRLGILGGVPDATTFNYKLKQLL
jgi:hypothetical protein